jgi:predicted GNAT family N-acyltransferase
MQKQNQFVVRQADFPSELKMLRQIRYEVFVVGQNVPADLEWAGDDDQHHHVLALDLEGKPIGTGRMSASGKIGRMAVLEPWRGQGVGSLMLKQLLVIAKKLGLTSVQLSSQVLAIPFYERHQFIPEGDVFVEAGIEHRLMVHRLS